MPPPPPLPPALHRAFSLLARLESPRHLLQAHAFLLPRGGHHNARLLSALLLASLRLPLRRHALALLRTIHPSLSLNAAARIPHLRATLGPQLHSLAVRAGLASDAHVSTSLIQTYFSCGSVASARTVFDEPLHKDIFCWNVTISGYVKSGNLACARAANCLMLCRRGTRCPGRWGVCTDEAASGGDRGVPEDAGWRRGSSLMG
jgi:hypothetical protein